MIILYFIFGVALIYLVFQLAHSSPFDRVFFKKKYALHFYDSSLIPGLTTITFARPCTSYLFREALYCCMYSLPATKSLSFINIGRLSITPERFEHFTFECLDFSNIASSDFNCLEPCSLPCSCIVLPNNCTKVPLRYSHPGLKCVAIPSPHFVPAQEYITFDPNGEPIRVHSDFHLKVPPHLIEEYRRNKVWQSISFIDEDGNVFHPKFHPYYSS